MAGGTGILWGCHCRCSSLGYDLDWSKIWKFWSLRRPKHVLLNCLASVACPIPLAWMWLPGPLHLAWMQLPGLFHLSWIWLPGPIHHESGPIHLIMGCGCLGPPILHGCSYLGPFICHGYECLGLSIWYGCGFLLLSGPTHIQWYWQWSSCHQSWMQTPVGPPMYNGHYLCMGPHGVAIVRWPFCQP